MIVKEKLFRKGFCAGLMAATFFVGIYGCETKSPTVSPVNPPQQQPLVESGMKTPAPIVAAMQNGVIRGRKFIDQDGNRLYGGSDVPETGWQIRLYPSTVSDWNAPIASTTTDSTGAFAFNGLASGQYVVASAQVGQTGAQMQQLTPVDTLQARCVTLPQQATTTCQPLAYQVTVDSGAQPCELAFMDAYGGAYPGAYGAYGGYPYGAYGAYGAYGGYPYGAYGLYPFGLAEIPVVFVDVGNDDCNDDHDDDHHHRTPTPSPTATSDD